MRPLAAISRQIIPISKLKKSPAVPQTTTKQEPANDASETTEITIPSGENTITFSHYRISRHLYTKTGYCHCCCSRRCHLALVIIVFSLSLSLLFFFFHSFTLPMTTVSTTMTTHTITHMPEKYYNVYSMGGAH